MIVIVRLGEGVQTSDVWFIFLCSLFLWLTLNFDSPYNLTASNLWVKCGCSANIWLCYESTNNGRNYSELPRTKDWFDLCVCSCLKVSSLLFIYLSTIHTLETIFKFIPIYKDNDDKNVTNYRPISLLPESSNITNIIWETCK